MAPPDSDEGSVPLSEFLAQVKPPETPTPAPAPASTPSTPETGQSLSDFVRSAKPDAKTAAPDKVQSISEFHAGVKDQPQLEDSIDPRLAPAVAPKAKDTALGQALQPFTDYVGDYISVKNRAEGQMEEGLNAIFQGKTVFERGLGALELAGAGLDWVASPGIAAARSFVGNPTERATGVPGLGEKIADWANFAFQLGIGTPAQAEKLIDKLTNTKSAIGIVDILSPTSRDPKKLIQYVGKDGETFVTSQAKATEAILRAGQAGLVQAREITAEQLDSFRKTIGQLPDGKLEFKPDGSWYATPDSKLSFTNAIETGNIESLPKDLQPAAQYIRDNLDFWREKIRSLGKGYLKHAIENYFPHIWKDPKKAAADGDLLDAALAHAQTKTTLLNKGAGFLKKRTIGDTLTGLARGHELISNNPLDLALTRLWEMQKFYHGHKMFDEMKQSGLIKYGKLGADVPKGWRALEGDEFKVFAPPLRAEFIAKHFNAYDPEIRNGLKLVADYLGIKIKTPLTDEVIESGAFGYTGRHLSEAVSRFGADEAVLMHEIGHQLDFKYGLSDYFKRDQQSWRELEDLARLRAQGPVSSAYESYLVKPTERIANLFHAYWHAPKLLQEVAPNAYDRLESFLSHNPSLQTVASMVKPSVRLEGETVEEAMARHGLGPQYMGKYYAPEAVQRLLSNFLSKGFRGNGLYDAIRSGGNALNQLQLAWPGFHAAFVTNDALVSKVAQALDEAVKGEYGRAAKSMAIASTVVGPVVEAFWKGSKIRTEYLNPGNSPKRWRDLVQALNAGGGRIKMDSFYKSGTESQSFINSFKNGTFLKDIFGEFKNHPLTALPRLISKSTDLLAYPIMDVMVPRVKAGAFSNMAENWIRRNPGASQMETRVAMSLIQDSIDNRLGQMVYDNLFWTKSLKDLSFMSVRSVGWNIGTVREIGGGVVDAGKVSFDIMSGRDPKLTHRMAYAFVLPFITGLEGAVATYLMTGRSPETLQDYWFPPTGGTTPAGGDERINLPSYVKDVMEYNQSIGTTLAHKLHPVFETAYEAFWDHKDYYGGLIADPKDPGAKQLVDWIKFFGGSATPFSYQAYRRMQTDEGSEVSPIISLFGLQPAPGYITNPERNEMYQQRQTNIARRKAIRERARLGEEEE